MTSAYPNTRIGEPYDGTQSNLEKYWKYLFLQMSSSDRALINAFREINGMADRINLAKTIVDRANNLFKQVHDGKNLKGRSNDAIASACLYIACRQEGVPRTFKVNSFFYENFYFLTSYSSL